MASEAKKFQENYWAQSDQRPTFRHQAALAMVNEGPILDVGAGSGLMLELLRERGIVGEGIELSGKAIAQAKKRGLRMRQFDITGGPLPYKTNTFRYVLLLDVLEHLLQPQIVLKESLRIGGEVIVAVPNFAFLGFRLQAFLGLVPNILSPRKGHTYYFTQGALERLTREAGGIVEERRHYFPLMYAPLVGIVSRILGNLWPSAFCTSFVYRVRRG